MNYRMHTAFVLMAVVVLSSSMADAQQVHRLRGADATSDKLIDVLKPHDTRGLKPVAGQQPQCAGYQRQLTRGITPPSTSDAVAIDVKFAYNSATLSSGATRSLDEVGKALTSPELSPMCFTIEGHTDSSGSDEYNMKLSQRRAETVVNFLAKQFKIERERLLPVGYGKSRPLADNETEEGRSQNRRVQIGSLGTGSEAQQ